MKPSCRGFSKELTMNNLRSYLMRKMPLMMTCEQANDFLDDYLAGNLSGSQRKIFQWHINLCA